LSIRTDNVQGKKWIGEAGVKKESCGGSIYRSLEARFPGVKSGISLQKRTVQLKKRGSYTGEHRHRKRVGRKLTYGGRGIEKRREKKLGTYESDVPGRTLTGDIKFDIDMFARPRGDRGGRAIGEGGLPRIKRDVANLRLRGNSSHEDL